MPQTLIKYRYSAPILRSEPPVPPGPSRRLRSRIPIIAHPVISTSLVTIPPRATGRRLLLLLPRTEAREQDDEHAQEQQYHGRQTGPHAHRVVRVGAFILLVDVVFDRLL